MANDSVDTTDIALQFNRLIRELLRGRASRETFQPWEVELLVDIHNCQIKESARENVLRRYQRVVQRRIAKGDTVPMKLSEFLGSRRKYLL
jgi:hypothetical protein